MRLLVPRSAVHGVRWLIAATLGLTLVGAALAASPLAVRPLPDDPGSEADEAHLVPPLTPGEQAQLAQFQEPDYSGAEAQQILALYAHVDPTRVIPRKLLDRALLYFHANKALLNNPRCLTVINFSSRSRLPRMFVADMASGAVTALHVAHGTGSDPSHTGLASRFSNTPNSKMSSLGFYKTAETYSGSHGLSCRLDGLSPTNSNARPRAVVLHGADYVEDTNVKPGRSWGCPAVSMENHVKVINTLKEGSLIHASLLE